MTPFDRFKADCDREIAEQGSNKDFTEATRRWIDAVSRTKYTYHFSWLGRPIIQFPQDIVAMQEIIWAVQPDLIIETGIAHGGSLVFSAAMLELNAACGGSPSAEVLGIDIDIRAHNRAAIEAHPMAKRISMIEGSSIAPDVIASVRERSKGKERVLVCLDSNHTHEHVLAELDAYALLTTIGSYCVVFDTTIDDLPVGSFPGRGWDQGANPKTAVRAWLKSHPEFEVDKAIQNKLMITVASDGYLRRIR
jgi:cephalosporin hydroxylase